MDPTKTPTASSFFEIVKSTKLDDGTLEVFGKATGPDLDRDKQVCDPAWLERAMPEWFAWGNVREMHGKTAAGVGTELEKHGDDWLLKARVVDPVSVLKVDTKVLKGFSVGIRNARVVRDPAAPGGRIVDGEIYEVSLVDAPANPTCTLAIAKSIDGTLTKVDEPLVEDEQVDVDYLAQATAALQGWLASEAAEVAAGTGGCRVVAMILELLQDLTWAAEVDAYDDAAAALAAVKTVLLHPPTQEDPMDLAKFVADLTKAASATDPAAADSVALVEVRKALGIDSTIEKLNATQAEVTKQAEELTKLAGEVTKVAGELAEVREIVPDTGPVRIRPLADTSKAVQADRLVAESERYLTLAKTVSDPALALGYRQLAAEKATEADQLRTAS